MAYLISYRRAGEQDWHNLVPEIDSRNAVPLGKKLLEDFPSTIDVKVLDMMTGEIIYRPPVPRFEGLSFQEYFVHCKETARSPFSEDLSPELKAWGESWEKNAMEFIWWHSQHGGVTIHHESVTVWKAGLLSGEIWGIDFPNETAKTPTWRVVLKCSCGALHSHIDEETPEEFRAF